MTSPHTLPRIPGTSYLQLAMPCALNPKGLEAKMKNGLLNPEEGIPTVRRTGLDSLMWPLWMTPLQRAEPTERSLPSQGNDDNVENLGRKGFRM